MTKIQMLPKVLPAIYTLDLVTLPLTSPLLVLTTALSPADPIAPPTMVLLLLGESSPQHKVSEENGIMGTAPYWDCGHSHAETATDSWHGCHM